MSTYDNTAITTENLIKDLNVVYNRKKLREQIKSHYRYPSLLSISDTLTQLNIRNKAFSIPKEKLDKVVFPAIFYLESTDSFITVNSFSEGYIYYKDPIKGSIKAEEQEFKKLWDGTVLMVSNSNENNTNIYKENLHKPIFRKNLFPILVTFLLYILLSYLFISGGKTTTFLFFTKTIGLLISVFLIKIDSKEAGAILSNLCVFGNYFNCNKTANSKIAKPFNIIRLSELSFLYFLTTLSCITIGLLSIYLEQILFILNIISFAIIPIVAFLFIYQIAYIRKICMFCLIIGLAIISESIILNNSSFNHSEINLNTILIITLSYLCSLILWYSYKQYFSKKSKITSLQFALNNFVQDPIYIKTTLENSRFIKPIKLNNDLSIGDINSKSEIIFILSIKCKHCYRALKTISLLNNQYPNIKITVRFNIDKVLNRNEYNYLSSIMNQHNKLSSNQLLQELVNLYKENRTNQALFIENEDINLCTEWIKDNSINIFPTVIINNSLLPSFINYESIIFYLKNL